MAPAAMLDPIPGRRCGDYSECTGGVVREGELVVGAERKRAITQAADDDGAQIVKFRF